MSLNDNKKCINILALEWGDLKNNHELSSEKITSSAEDQKIHQQQTAIHLAISEDSFPLVDSVAFKTRAQARQEQANDAPREEVS